MKKPVLTFLVLFCSISFLRAQPNEDTLAFRKNTVYIELLGAGILHSVNYERLIKESKRIKLYGRLGFTPVYMPGVAFEPVEYMFPFGIAIVYKGKNNSKNKQLYFEQGIYPAWILHESDKYEGTTFINSALYLGISVIGWRGQFANGFYARTGFGVMGNIVEIYYNDFIIRSSPLIWPLIEISFGYMFLSKKNKKKNE